MKLAKLIDQRLHIALMKLIMEPLPLKAAFKLKGITKKINEECNKYDEVRNEALNRLGDKAEDGALRIDERGNVQLSDDNLNKLTNEINSLLEVEVEIPTISIAELGESVKLSVADLEFLEGIILE